MEQAPVEVVFAAQPDPECGYRARALGYSIFTHAETLDELRAMIRDAVACYWDEGNKPSVIRLILSQEELLAA